MEVAENFVNRNRTPPYSHEVSNSARLAQVTIILAEINIHSHFKCFVFLVEEDLSFSYSFSVSYAENRKIGRSCRWSPLFTLSCHLQQLKCLFYLCIYHLRVDKATWSSRLILKLWICTNVSQIESMTYEMCLYLRSCTNKALPAALGCRPLPIRLYNTEYHLLFISKARLEYSHRRNQLLQPPALDYGWSVLTFILMSTE